MYVALDGGTVRIDRTDPDAPPGGLVRVAPERSRSVRNAGDDREAWLMFGAPPVGTVGDFGEYRTADG